MTVILGNGCSDTGSDTGNTGDTGNGYGNGYGNSDNNSTNGKLLLISCFFDFGFFFS